MMGNVFRVDLKDGDLDDDLVEDANDETRPDRSDRPDVPDTSVVDALLAAVDGVVGD